jgi:sulfur-carrier protein adenylyltransferase/sulfurtransferase
MEIKEISVRELKELQDKSENCCLIDVRNPSEFEYCNLDGKLIPMSEITERFEEIAKEGKVIIHCHHGGRSKKVIAWMQDQHGYTNLYNLTGGIHAWSTHIDTSIDIY